VKIIIYESIMMHFRDFGIKYMTCFGLKGPLSGINNYKNSGTNLYVNIKIIGGIELTRNEHKKARYIRDPCTSTISFFVQPLHSCI